MSQFYILVEGVNIYANVFDTSQLSVIRGTSLLYKRAIEIVSDRFKAELIPISTGASSGLYYLKDDIYKEKDIDSDSKISIFNAALSKRVSDTINNHKELRFLSFIVECCFAKDLLTAKEKLLTQLRIRQMQSIIIAPDIIKSNNRPDELEGHRIAPKFAKNKRMVQGKLRQLSDSVCTRLDYGRKQRQNLYFDRVMIDELKEEYTNKEVEETIKALKAKSFCDDFEQLSENSGFTKLDNKIAVVYMDGNSFSKKQKKLIETAQNNQQQIEAQGKFDKNIKGKRAILLYDMLKSMQENTHALTSDKEKLRFETLLWGGDEMLFVMPAWLGFEFLHEFFNKTKNWKLDDLEGNEKELTHAAGIVFCHAKTPIANIRNLVQSIADNIKEVCSDEDYQTLDDDKKTPEIQSPNEKGGRQQNAWGYMVLESIDYPTSNSVKDYNDGFYGKELSEEKPTLIPAYTGDDLNEILLSSKNLKNEQLLPTSQLYKIVHTIKREQRKLETLTLSWETLEQLNPTKEELKTLHPIEKQEFRLLQVTQNKNELSQELKRLAELVSISLDDPRKRIWLWIYLYELREYICPEISNKASVK